MPSVCRPSACVLPSTCLSHAFDTANAEGAPKANILSAFMFRLDSAQSAIFDFDTSRALRALQPTGPFGGPVLRTKSPASAPPQPSSVQCRAGEGPVPNPTSRPPHHSGTGARRRPLDPVPVDAVHRSITPRRYPRHSARLRDGVRGASACARPVYPSSQIVRANPLGAGLRGRALGAVPCGRAPARARAPCQRRPRVADPPRRRDASERASEAVVGDVGARRHPALGRSVSRY